MRLDPGDQGRDIYVAVGRSRAGAFDGVTEKGRLLCLVTLRLNRDLEVIQMETIASFVAQAALRREALLLHGALAEYCGSGFIMAGPGTVGKSTASRRLPAPWRSLSDDMTLVVRDDKGQYWAHPWPTWSRFHFGGPRGSWAVEQAVPLRAVFFLSQSPSDRLESVTATQATALTLESAVNFARSTSCPVSFGIHAAKALASAVPAYSLKLSLVGRFWEEIERALPVGTPESQDSRTPTLSDRGRCGQSLDPSSAFPAQFPSDGSILKPSPVADGSLRLVYSGTGMNPTFQGPELLEVQPYGVRRVRPGDVVCYESPATGKTVVHRVVSTGGRRTGDGGPKDEIRTRGDNSRADDCGLLRAGDIIGRVTAAQRGARRRAIRGGWTGLVALRCVRLGQGIRRSASFLPHELYDLATGLGPFHYLLPRRFRPRLVRFDARCRVVLKLLSGRRTVGQYDAIWKRWRIRRPFRLFVDEQTLTDAGSLASVSEPGHVS
jgi:hypothetical protein